MNYLAHCSPRYTISRIENSSNIERGSFLHEKFNRARFKAIICRQWEYISLSDVKYLLKEGIPFSIEIRIVPETYMN